MGGRDQKVGNDDDALKYGRITSFVTVVMVIKRIHLQSNGGRGKVNVL